jgi:hypothetical protein
MRRGCFVLFFAAVAAVAPALADDQEKAEKQARMMTAMSRDDTARSIVSRTFADVFKVERPQLVAERRSLGLNYGSLFLMHELVASGSSTQEIAAQLRLHKTMFEIANTFHADWKRIVSDAKKMNSRIDDNIYKHFLSSGKDKDKERDLLDHYTPAVDLVRADGDATPEEIQRAQTEYVFRRDLSGPKPGGAAERSDAVNTSYEQKREAIVINHGEVPLPGR